MLPLKHYANILLVLFAMLFRAELFAKNIATEFYDKSKAAINDYRMSLNSWDSLIRGFRRYAIIVCLLVA